jgi:hypothetical protein
VQSGDWSVRETANRDRRVVEKQPVFLHLFFFFFFFCVCFFFFAAGIITSNAKHIIIFFFFFFLSRAAMGRHRTRQEQVRMEAQAIRRYCGERNQVFVEQHTRIRLHGGPAGVVLEANTHGSG